MDSIYNSVNLFFAKPSNIFSGTMSGLRKRGKSPQITKKKSIPLLNKAGHHLKSAAPDNQKAHERKFKVALAFVTLLAFYSRFYKIATPDEVV